jgi:hypothetical protein
VENRGFDQTIDADGWPTDLRHSVYRILDSGGLGILFGGCAFSISVVCELLEGAQQGSLRRSSDLYVRLGLAASELVD